MTEVKDSNIRATLAGFASVVLWSTTMGLSRLCSESLGVLTSGGTILLVAGIIGVVLWYRRRGVFSDMVKAHPKYFYGCGALFIVYGVSIYSAIGFAENRSQVLEVSVINYLWPSLTQVISLWVFGYKARWSLILGMIVAIAGVVMALAPDGGYSSESLKANLTGNIWPYVLGFSAAGSWALYSNLSKLWGNGIKVRGVPVFFVVSGTLMLILAKITGEQPQWSVKICTLVAVMAVGPALLAYHFWDIAMQRGNMHAVVSFAYLTPVLSVIVCCVVFKTLGTWTLWTGCALVIAGAITCAKSINNPNM